MNTDLRTTGRRRWGRGRAVVLGGLLLSLSTLLAVAGCDSQSALPSERIVVAVDRSESTDAFRKEQLDAVDYASEAAIAHEAAIDIWCYDTSAVRVYGPRVPSRFDAVNVVKRDQMIPDAAHPRRRTRPAVLLEDIDHALGESGAPAKADIVLLTDGDNEFAGDGRRIDSALSAIAARPGARIAVIGVTPENRAVWAGRLAPRFGPGRFIVADLKQSEDALRAAQK